MTVSAPAKLATLKALLSSPPRAAGSSGTSTSMRSSRTPPEAMAPDFSGVGRAVEIYHAKIAGTDRNVLTAGVDAACLKS